MFIQDILLRSRLVAKFLNVIEARSRVLLIFEAFSQDVLLRSIVRSVLFVEGGLNTNCTVKSNLFGSSNFELRNKLIAEYK